MCSIYRAEAQAQGQRRLWSSQTPYMYCNHSHQEIQTTTPYEMYYNSRTSMDTCTYWHTWKRSGKQESKLSYQDAKTLFRNKRLADFKHINGGCNPQQDTLRLPSRHEQTMIFRLRKCHCRLRSHMKKIGIEKSALCPWGLEAQTIALALQSCPLHKRESNWPTESSLGNNSMEQPPTYAWRWSSSPWWDYKYNKSTSNAEEEVGVGIIFYI